MPGMRRSLLALALAWPAAAPASTHWLCGLSGDLTLIVCVADVDPARSEPAVESRVTATVNGTRFPLDPRKTYRVPLWSPAIERVAVEQLAQATLCYRTPECTVTLVAPMLEPAPGHREASRRG